MFFKKAIDKDTHGSQDIFEKTGSRYNKEVIEFVNSTKTSLKRISEQHNRVNSQHHDLGELTENIQGRMNLISSRTDDTNNATINLSGEVDKLLKTTTDTVTASQEGKSAIENLVEIIKVLDYENNNNKNMITELANKFAKVTEVVSLIDNIASQTNILALNASIEAARAGEHGKGFAVVAGEVGKLATQTKKSTVDIANLISNISEETEKVKDNAEKSVEVIKKGVATSIEAIDKIEFSLSSVSEVDEEVKKVISILGNQKDNIEDMITEIESIDEILKVTARAIISHIEEASVIDKHLEVAERNVDKFENQISKN